MSVTAVSASWRARAGGQRPQIAVVALALGAAGSLAWAAGAFGWRMAALALIGVGLGFTLFAASFSFVAAYRRLILYRETRGVEAHVLLLALTTLLFAPLLAGGAAFGQTLSGASAPVGVQVAVGAAMFGLGMQLGGGCGSGALYAAGGGSPRMLLTLAAFCAGAFWGSLHLDFWLALPRWPELVLGRVIGWGNAAALQLAVLAALWLALRRLGRLPAEPRSPAWPLAAGAAALAVLNATTLAVAGHPWAITWGFTLWGAKAAALFGWSPQASWFWTGGYTEAALAASQLADTVTVTNLGILAGVLLAAGAAGRFAPAWRMQWRSALAAIIGGLLMGYGARLSFGCNIGAFVSGIASTSLHGWAWIVFALPGCWLGVRLRPLFGLQN